MTYLITLTRPKGFQDAEYTVSDHINSRYTQGTSLDCKIVWSTEKDKGCLKVVIASGREELFVEKYLLDAVPKDLPQTMGKGWPKYDNWIWRRFYAVFLESVTKRSWR